MNLTIDLLHLFIQLHSRKTKRKEKQNSSYDGEVLMYFSGSNDAAKTTLHKKKSQNITEMANYPYYTKKIDKRSVYRIIQYETFNKSKMTGDYNASSSDSHRGRRNYVFPVHCTCAEYVLFTWEVMALASLLKPTAQKLGRTHVCRPVGTYDVTDSIAPRALLCTKPQRP